MDSTSAEAPRWATVDDFPAIMELVDRCFRRIDGGMAAEWGHCYDESIPDRHAVIECDGRIVSHAAFMPDSLLIHESELETWGITGVATDPSHRGQGHMTALMEFLLNAMDDRDVPFAKLGGDRQRYNRFGWEYGGVDRHYTVTDRSFRKRPEVDDTVRRFDGSNDDLQLLKRLYRTRSLRVKRDETRWRDRLNRSHLETLLLSKPNSSAYMTIKRGSASSRITDIAGDNEGVRTLLAHAFERYSLTSIECRLHPSESLNGLFVDPRVSGRWKTVPHRLIRINDLASILDAYTPVLSRKLASDEVSDRTITMAIDEEPAAVTLTWDSGNFTVTSTRNEPDVELDRLSMTRILFGYQGTVDASIGDPLLDAIVPLEFYLPRTDQV